MKFWSFSAAKRLNRPPPGHGWSRGCHLGARRIGRQLVVLRIELGQHLAGLDPLAQLGLAAHDLAGHPKAQARLHPRPHLAGKLVAGDFELGHPHGQHLDGAHGFLGRSRFGAGRQHQCGTTMATPARTRQSGH
jgi:hypothetical protein